MKEHVFSDTDLRNLIKPYTKNPFVFLETASFDKENKRSFLFTDFSKILTFNYGDNINKFFKEAEGLLAKGYWLCGYFSYEFGYFLEPALHNLIRKFDFPLVWLAASKNPTIINHLKHKPMRDEAQSTNLNYTIKNIVSNISQHEYSQAIKKIKKHLEEGLTYQVNFTFKMKFSFEGEALDLYLNLRRAQPTSYMSFINTGKNQILSMSPELFFKLEKDRIISRPMKGTIKRANFINEDDKNQSCLKNNKKTKAENIMIVDLLRNDLGRISKKVWVPKLFEVERYRTLHQMTSTIAAKAKKNLTIKEIFSSLFPCGSVTGAPKIKTMQITQQLEKEPRNIYTGAIGYISPKAGSCFNVAIRTVLLDKQKGELGIGGGIVYDSLDKAEYDEALLKAKFLTQRFPKFCLIESLLWQPKRGYSLLDLHLKRLKASCKYFSIPLDFGKLKKDLLALERSLEAINHKIRILVNINAQTTIEKEPLGRILSPVKVKLSHKKINPSNIFLYHKTTNRALYDRERTLLKKEGFFEAIFTNTKGELTEGTITNIFILKEGRLYTPQLQSGLLGGVFRKHLLEKGRACEKVLFIKDLQAADKVYIGNSLRGLIEAKVNLADLENKSKMKVYA